MDYTKKHRENTYSLLMEKWGYGSPSGNMITEATGSDDSDADDPANDAGTPSHDGLPDIKAPPREAPFPVQSAQANSPTFKQGGWSGEGKPYRVPNKPHYPNLMNTDEGHATSKFGNMITEATGSDGQELDPKDSKSWDVVDNPNAEVDTTLPVSRKELTPTRTGVNTKASSTHVSGKPATSSKYPSGGKRAGPAPTKKPKFMKEAEYDFEEEEPLVNADVAGYSPSVDVPASMMSELSQMVREELTAALGEAAGMWDTPPPPNPTPQRSGGGMPPKHSPAKKGEEYSVVGGGWGLGSLEGYGEGEFLPDLESQKWIANKLDKIYKPYGQGKAGMSHVPGGTNPSGMINSQGQYYDKDWSEQAGDMLDATSTNSDDPWVDIEQAPYAKPVEGPITMPKTKPPTTRQSDPNWRNNTIPRLEEQLRQIVREELKNALKGKK